MPDSDDLFLPFSELSSSIDIDGLRIRAMPKPDIFVCGGPVKLSSPAASARQVFMEKVGENDSNFFSRFVLAEDIARSWFCHNNYVNLLDLEEDLAQLATGILIFLESAGSFTELGAFVQTKHLADKIIVILDSQYSDNESFINLGPLKKLTKLCGKNSVICYSHSDIAYSYKKLKDIICLKCRQKERKFNSNRFEDLCVLILEIIYFARYAKKKRLYTLLKN